LIREIARRNNLSFASIVLWGAAFGIYEEGVLLKSWTDPTRSAFFARGGQVGGFIVLDAVYLTILHAVISITAPILIVEVWSKERGPWLSKSMLLILGLIFFVASYVSAVAIGGRQIEFWQYVICLALIGGLLFAGWKIKPISGGTSVPSALSLFLQSFLVLSLYTAAFFPLVLAHTPWFIIVALGLAVVSWYVMNLLRIDWSQIDPRRKFSLGAGLVSSMLTASLILLPAHPETSLNTVVDIALILCLPVLYRWVPQGNPVQ